MRVTMWNYPGVLVSEVVDGRMYYCLNPDIPPGAYTFTRENGEELNADFERISRKAWDDISPFIRGVELEEVHDRGGKGYPHK